MQINISVPVIATDNHRLTTGTCCSNRKFMLSNVPAKIKLLRHSAFFVIWNNALVTTSCNYGVWCPCQWIWWTWMCGDFSLQNTKQSAAFLTFINSFNLLYLSVSSPTVHAIYRHHHSKSLLLFKKNSFILCRWC